MKFYRTYITKVNLSSGIKYYAGKHESEYENPIDDPYVGSGMILKRAIAKYGISCIVGVEWFEHTENTVDDEEVKLISQLKEKHGELCVNIASGGTGGHTQKYSSEEDKIATGKRKSESGLIRWSSDEERKKQSTRMAEIAQHAEWRENVSSGVNNGMTELHRRGVGESSRKRWMDEEYRLKMSRIHKEVNSREEVRRKKSETQKIRMNNPTTKAMTSTTSKERWLNPEYRENMVEKLQTTKRVGEHWDLYRAGKLTPLWIESNSCGSAKKFATWLRKNSEYTIPWTKLTKIVELINNEHNNRGKLS